MEEDERQELLDAVAGATRDAINEQTKTLTERMDAFDERITAFEKPQERAQDDPTDDAPKRSLYAEDRTKAPARFRSGLGAETLDGVLRADPKMVMAVGDVIRTMAAAKAFNITLTEATEKFAHRAYGNDEAVDHLRALNESTGSEGGVFVPIQYSADFVQLLYAKVVLTAAGAHKMRMPRGNLRIPRQTAGATAQATSETGKIASSQGTYGFVDLTAKDITALVPISQDLLKDAGYDANAFVVSDLIMQMKLQLDYQGLYGTGGVNILGLAHVSGVGSTTASTAAAARMNIDLEALEANYWAQNPMDVSPAYISHPRLRTLLMFAQTTTGDFVFRDELARGTLFGRPFLTTTQVPIASNKTDLWLGDFNDLVVGDAEDTRIDTSTEASYEDAAGTARSAFQYRMALIRGQLRADAAPMHPAVFQKIASIDLTNWSWT